MALMFNATNAIKRFSDMHRIAQLAANALSTERLPNQREVA
jgi:hypothetical protein